MQAVTASASSSLAVPHDLRTRVGGRRADDATSRFRVGEASVIDAECVDVLDLTPADLEDSAAAKKGRQQVFLSYNPLAATPLEVSAAYSSASRDYQPARFFDARA